jgi:hypothetical protein
MAAAIYADFIAAFREDITRRGDQSFTYAGTAVPCIFNRLTKGSAPTDGGLWGEYSASVNYLADDLATAPVQGRAVTVAGVNYIVGTVRASSENPLVTMMLQSGATPK